MADREPPLRPVLILAGPTAVGKSSLALAAAAEAGAEILSADSRQLYRGLDIGTATPTPRELAAVPHHGIDTLDPEEPYSAGRFLEDARRTIAEVQARGRDVIVVGGSTLYVHALIEGLAELPPVSQELIEALTAHAATADGRRQLFEELEAADPVAAQTLDPSKSQRLVRFVGLLRQTGQPPSRQWREAPVPGVPARLVVLDRPRPELYERINARVEQMMTAGLLDEVTRLLDRGLAVRALVHATIGYRELAAFLDGETSLERAVALVQRNSRRYAKRQLTWYRRYDEATWLDARTATPADVLALVPWPSST